MGAFIEKHKPFFGQKLTASQVLQWDKLQKDRVKNQISLKPTYMYMPHPYTQLRKQVLEAK